MSTAFSSTSLPTDEIAQPHKDCWIGVTDPKKRKQIQDRLAQRARRKRLAEAQTGAETSSSQLVRRRNPQSNGQTPAHIGGLAKPLNAETITFLPIPINVYSALWRNGTVLGLSCSSILPLFSRECGPEVPEPLRPTSMQLVTQHPHWIDRFPFPHMRDNFITMLEIIDAEDFLQDIFSAPSFSLENGADSWDPKAWKIEQNFAKKWGFLFDPNFF